MKLSTVARKMLFGIVVTTAVLIAGGVVFCFALSSLSTEDILPVTLGILLSSLINVVRVFLLDRQVRIISEMEDTGRVKAYASGQALLRFFLTGAGLVAAHFIPFTNLIAAIAGAFTWNIAAFALRYMKLEDDEDIKDDGKSDETQPE